MPWQIVKPGAAVPAALGGDSGDGEGARVDAVFVCEQGNNRPHRTAISVVFLIEHSFLFNSQPVHLLRKIFFRNNYFYQGWLFG